MHGSRLTILSAIVATTALSISGTGDARSPARGAATVAAPSPFLGAWRLDLTRMPDSYGIAPKSVIYTFTDMGDGTWRTTIEITAHDDSVRRMAIRYRRDGRAARTDGDTLDGDGAALLSPASNVLVMSIAKDAHLGSVRTYTISPDGSGMTEAAANVDSTGAPFVRVFHFTRVR